MYYYNQSNNYERGFNVESLIASEVGRISEKYNRSFLDCNDIIELTGLGRDNVRALMNSKAFPVVRVGNRQIVSIAAFVTWQIFGKPEERNNG